MSYSVIGKVEAALNPLREHNAHRTLDEAMNATALWAIHTAVVVLVQTHLFDDDAESSKNDSAYPGTLMAVTKMRLKEEDRGRLYQLSAVDAAVIKRIYVNSFLTINMMYTVGRTLPSDEELVAEISAKATELLKIATS